MSQQNGAVPLDSILEQLGPFGKFIIVNYALLLFPMYLAGIYGSVYVFEAPDISYRCQITECENQNNTSWLYDALPYEKEELSKCKRYRYVENISEITCTAKDFNKSIVDECSAFIYSDKDSAVKDFDLACANWKRTLIGTIHNAGLFISLPLTGIISDKYGRRVALSVASLINGVCGFLRSFSTSYVIMLVFEFLETALGGGMYCTAFVLAMELVGPKGRNIGNAVINTAYALGIMTLGGLAWWLQSWRNILRVIYSPAILVLSYLWILNESVRWLLSKRQNHDAVLILKKAAEMNKVEISEEVLATLYELERKAISDQNEKENEKTDKLQKAAEVETSTFLRVIKSNIIRKRVLVCSFIWITCSFVYNGLSINSVSLAGNQYVNFMLVGFVEIPANVVSWLVLDKFGRKKTLIITFVLNACLCISLSLVPRDQKWWSLVLYLTEKSAITVSYNALYVYASELFPTSVRQSLIAFCSTIGRVGTTLAPMTPLLALYYDNLPAIFFGSLALVASVLMFTLPETMNVPLPDTIEEAERLSWRSNKK